MAPSSFQPTPRFNAPQKVGASDNWMENMGDVPAIRRPVQEARRRMKQSSVPQSQWLKVLGPGILFASTAIGVSHLVQSTRAGALVGFGLVWAVLAANVAKYPFFEFGSRYANATGETLIEGYQSMGRWASVTYLVITIGTCFFVMGAIGIVTASFLDNLLGISEMFGFNGTPRVAVAVFALSTGILFWGQYGALDRLIKIIAGVLLISTVAAFAAALFHTPISAVPPPPVDFSPWSGAGLAFLIALMGWMPTAVDLSTWNSIWTLERIRQTGYHPPLKDTIREFNIGFLFSAVLALLFLGLGALLFYAHSVQFPEGTAAFAAGVVQLYTEAIGSWSWWIIAAAAFSAMLGTCIACLDGYSRSLGRSVATLRNQKASIHHERIALVVVGSGALTLILAFPNDIRILVDIATTLSFLVAPLVAAANLHLVTRPTFPTVARPPKWLVIQSWLGLAFLIGFGMLYLFSA